MNTSGTVNRNDAMVEGYLQYLEGVGRKAHRTILDVRCTLGRIEKVMSNVRPGIELWHMELKDYLQWIERERRTGCSGRHLCKMVSHLRGFLEYSWRNGKAVRNVLDGFSIQDDWAKVEPRSLSMEEALGMIERLARDTAIDRMNRLIVLLLYGCGLRTDELCQLNLSDVNTERREILVRRGKGDRQRSVPIPEGVYTSLLEYIMERGRQNGQLLYNKFFGKTIRHHYVCRVVQHARLRAGIEWKVTPRTLRHSYATHLMDRGVDIGVISMLMGHRSPAETGIYLHALKGRDRDAINRISQSDGGSKA